MSPADSALSETAATPVQSRRHSQQSRQHPHEDFSLSEATAPAPISQDPPQRHLWSNIPLPEAEKFPSGPREPSHAQPPSPPLSRLATYLFTVSYLVFFSIFGTLARLGLQALTYYHGAPVVTSVLWANVGGSLLMGFFLEDRNLFREEWGDADKNLPDDEHEMHEHAKRHKSAKKTIPLYIGLTTGFCGCFTSFSSFIRDVFLALSNDLPNPSGSIPSRNGGYSFMALVAVILLTVSLSLGALIFGAHLALALTRFTPIIPFKFTRRFLDPLFIFLAWGCWLGAIFLSIWPPDRNSANEVWRGRALFAIVFAPLGCLARFCVSLYLNPRIPPFPLGTFVANIFGSIILAMAYDLQHVRGIGAPASSSSGSASTYSILVSCQILQGIMDGFCGSLTTVSTWVAEMNGLGQRRHAYFYGLLSVAVALGFLVVIMGSLRWTLGFASSVCPTYTLL